MTSAWNKRDEANQMANQRPHPQHISNEEEQRFRHQDNTNAAREHYRHQNDCITPNPTASTNGYDINRWGGLLNLNNLPSYLMSFTKGMPHNPFTGLLQNPQHIQYFVRAIDSGNPRDFRDTPLGPEGHIGTPYNCVTPKAEAWFSPQAKAGGTVVTLDKAGIRNE